MATTARTAYVSCARCAVSFNSGKGVRGWAGLFISLENRHFVCKLYAFLPPNRLGEAACPSERAAVGPLSPCALTGGGWLS